MSRNRSGPSEVWVAKEFKIFQKLRFVFLRHLGSPTHNREHHKNSTT
jgi:hypothetical protein